MLNLLINWVISALILLLVSSILPGMHIEGIGIALLAAFVLGVLNVLIKPVLTLLTLPINIVTLGLFSFVINALIIGLAAWMVPGFEISNFLSALLAAVLLSIISAVVNNIFRDKSGAAV